MPLKQPQTFLLPQAANVVKQLLGWGTSKVHWEQQFYFSIKHRNRAFFLPPSLALPFFFWMKQCPGFLISKTLFRFAWPLHNLRRSSKTSKRNCESYWMKKTFLYFIKVENCCIPCLWNLHEWFFQELAAECCVKLELPLIPVYLIIDSRRWLTVICRGLEIHNSLSTEKTGLLLAIAKLFILPPPPFEASMHFYFMF